MSAEFTFAGVDQVLANLAAIGSNIPDDSGGALKEIAEEIMTASQVIVPLDLGPLKNSGHVDDPVVRKGQVSVAMGYGGQAEDYAVVQHEDLTLNHQGAGEAKYLEKPMNAAAADFPEKLGRKMASRLGLGGSGRAA